MAKVTTRTDEPTEKPELTREEKEKMVRDAKPTATLRSQYSKEHTDALAESVDEPTEDVRTKESLLAEAIANRKVAEKAEAEGNYETAAHHFSNEKMCLEAAKTAPHEPEPVDVVAEGEGK